MAVCKDLDYLRAEFVSSGSYFGDVDTDFTANLNCNQYDDHILECGRSNIQHCGANDVAGVVCA